MPGSGTHTTVLQHLAQENLTFQGPLGSLTARDLLGNPNLNMSWGTYFTDDALKSRYAILGAMGPDIFYAMLDYGSDIQMFEDVVIKILGTFQCVGQVSGEVGRLIDGPANTLTAGLWDAISNTVTNVSAVLKEGALDLVIDQHNFWSLFLPLRQVDDFRSNWYWADYLHYVKTGAFTRKLLDMSMTYSSDEKTTGFLKAYALGYLTHYVADTVGHAYVNRIVESPWRNCWQRHHLVENFIDAYLWDHWHNISTIPQRPADEPGLDETIDKTTAGNPGRRIGDGAPLHYARLNDLSNIGGVGIDKTVDAAITAVCDQIQSGLFDLGLSSVPPHSAPDDAAFITWANFMSDAMQQTYPPAQNDHPNRLTAPVFLPKPDPCRVLQGGYPTPDDIASAYSAYRMILSLATEDKLTAPPFPDIVGDIAKILDDLWKDINRNLGAIPPPPPIPSSGGFSLDALWDAIKSYGVWLGQVLIAVLKTVGDVIAAALKITGNLITEPIKVALWLLNSLLFAIYRNFRSKLVLAAYAVPFSDELTGTAGELDMRTLWTTMAGGAQPYPIEPLVSQRDLASDPTHAHSPYRPYFKPSDVMPAPNIELPATFAPTELLVWATPDDMLEKPLGKDNMLMASGPAPPMAAPLLNTDGTVKTTLESFDGTQRYFGGIFANCEAALRAVVPYIAGGSWPEGTVLPDYNLDSDRGYAWPCWDVDFTSRVLPWNGCDPYPDDTVTRANLPSMPNNILAILSTQPKLSWGLPPPPPRAGSASVDPWNMPRNGLAFVNAAALVDAGAGFPTFAWLTVDPSVKDRIDPETPTLDDLDKCVAAAPASPGGNLTADYQKAPMEFLQNDPNDWAQMDPDLTQPTENDGRLSDFLRAHANLRDPLNILANAVTLFMNKTVVLPPPAPPVPSTANLDGLVMAVAQLAITGRDSFSKFNAPQDADLIKAVTDLNPKTTFDAAQLAATAHNVLDMAYLTLWAIRGNDPGWRVFRGKLDTQLDAYFGKPSTYTKWIAVSGFDDTSHRPVNVPTAPYPQFDITFSVPPFDGTTPQHPKMTTRYMVASAHTWVGPNDPLLSSFTAADPAWQLLQAPIGPPFSSTPAPRTVPSDEPTIPPGNEIIIYIHGGGSRAEEAVAMANWLIYEGTLVGHNYTVVSLDLPNSAYANRFQVSDLVGSTYQPELLKVRDFDLQYILKFIDALELKIGNVKGRIKAVMGGSLGGNMSLLLARENIPGLDTIVAWSVTAVSTMYYLGFISSGWVGAHLAHLQEGAMDSELTGTPRQDHSKETEYLRHVYFDPLAPGIPLLVPFIPPDPIMWYRGPDPVADTPTVISDWAQCKKDSIKASRFDRYEIYSECARHWTNAIDLEQISFSFHDDCTMYDPIARSATSRLLLAAGERDNYAPNAIYNSTIELAHLIRHTARGKAEFWLDTGHSIHAERPHLFAKEIINFLAQPGAGDSPFGTVGAPQPAPFSVTNA